MSLVAIVFLGLFAAPQQAAAPGSEIKIDKITVKQDPDNANGYLITVQGTMTLGVQAKKVKNFTFELFDPNKKTVIAAIRPFAAPVPGQSSQFTLSPTEGSVLLKGKWSVSAAFQDDTGKEWKATETFLIPPKD
jgi:hypothetical protein